MRHTRPSTSSEFAEAIASDRDDENRLVYRVESTIVHTGPAPFTVRDLGRQSLSSARQQGVIGNAPRPLHQPHDRTRQAFHHSVRQVERRLQGQRHLKGGIDRTAFASISTALPVRSGRAKTNDPVHRELSPAREFPGPLGKPNYPKGFGRTTFTRIVNELSSNNNLLVKNR